MNRNDVKKILKYEKLTPIKYLLSIVNLTEKEKLSIEYVDIKGMSEEEATEYVNRSRTSIQKYRKSGYDKLIKVWNDEKLAHEILYIINQKQLN